ncbi:LarC family nickel insertion protein [uncultured Bilophila sp.]|uniref:LarC family nickel insertion protein n=1 Tax=uncultured Bilophila sp. TaxID=529385 RepID=UPI00280BB0F4|nr:LarC family nickel insertion protein [uncultured Bilophila sp.]
MSEVHAHGEHGHRHGHGAHHGESHTEGHDEAGGGRILTIRSHSGLSGDMFLAGLLRMTELDEAETDALLTAVLPDLAGAVRLTRKQVNRIGGWFAEVSLPHRHEHRTLADILGIIAGNGMDEAAKRLASDTFTLLAEAEAAVHGMKPEAVHFHEVGALDSILDICMACALFTRLAPSRFVASPLPIADGEVACAHGIIPVPAPAVLELLEGIPVRPFSGEGETVTPTAIALLRSLGATFGPWPAMRVEKRALVYGSRVFPNAPNGTIFACGTAYGE